MCGKSILELSALTQHKRRHFLAVKTKPKLTHSSTNDSMSCAVWQGENANPCERNKELYNT
jgi:hypothetical protein